MSIIESSQDQEVANIIAASIFGWFVNYIPEAPARAEAVMKALHDAGYVITKVESPL
jgi:hypothetical protein